MENHRLQSQFASIKNEIQQMSDANKPVDEDKPKRSRREQLLADIEKNAREQTKRRQGSDPRNDDEEYLE